MQVKTERYSHYLWEAGAVTDGESQEKISKAGWMLHER